MSGFVCSWGQSHSHPSQTLVLVQISCLRRNKLYSDRGTFLPSAIKVWGFGFPLPWMLTSILIEKNWPRRLCSTPKLAFRSWGQIKQHYTCIFFLKMEWIPYLTERLQFISKCEHFRRCRFNMMALSEWKIFDSERLLDLVPVPQLSNLQFLHL